jgi:hypothetical protein
MINTEQLRELIIKPTLSRLNMYSKSAEELLVFTCAAETNGGEWLKQVQGPALGIYQCEPNTYHDIWRNYIMHRSGLLSIFGLKFGVVGLPDENRLIGDLYYATAICRIHYRRVKEDLPDGGNQDALWAYYKKYYNTPLGKATKKKSLDAYRRVVKDSPYQGALIFPTD